MKTLYIFNADDFGPIDFINRGVIKAVKIGMINSVQVIVNGDSRNSLAKKLTELSRAVPDGKTVDIGIHYTLTSGEPLTPIGVNQKAKKDHWKELVKIKDDTCFFLNFKKFNFNYKSHLPAIRNEFLAQKNKLGDIIHRVNVAEQNQNLVFSSASSHHNTVTISTVLFNIFLEVSAMGRYPVYPRSPKSIPKLRMFLYYRFAISLINFTDKRHHRKHMIKQLKAFRENRFLAKQLHLKSPNYTEFGFYNNLGSFSIFNIFSRDKLRKRKNKYQKSWFKMMERIKAYKPSPEVESTKVKVVEFVFHLGYPDKQNTNYKNMVINYEGITHKYFDDRVAETEFLEALQKSGFHQEDVIDHLTSWKNCQFITYLKGEE